MFRFAFETMPEKIVALNLTCIKTFYHIVSYLLLRSCYIVNSSRAIKFSTNRMEKIKHRPVPLGQWNANFMFTCTHTHWPLSLDTWFHIDRSIVSHLRDIFITQTNECTHNKKKYLNSDERTRIIFHHVCTSSRTKTKSTPSDRYFTQRQ